MLLILDEAQTGLCRTGDWYAFQHEGVVRTSSRSPRRSARVSAGRRTDQPGDRGARPRAGFLFFTTHVSDPLPAAVGNTVLDVLVRDRLDERARVLGAALRDGLDKLAARHDVVGDVRGRGLLLGMELVGDDVLGAGGADRLGAAVTRRCFERGLHMKHRPAAGMGGIFRIAPPLTASDEEIARGVGVLDEALADAARDL